MLDGEIVPPGCHIFRKDHAIRGDGVKIVVKDSFRCIVIVISDDIESEWCSVRTGGDVVIAAVYRPHGSIIELKITSYAHGFEKGKLCYGGRYQLGKY